MGEEVSEDPVVMDMPKRRFWALEGGGPFHTCGKKFAELHEKAKAEGLTKNKTAMLVLCDVPNTSKEDLVWACGILIDEQDKSATSPPEGLSEIVVPEGKFATAIHKGDYAGLPKSWGSLCMKWVPQQGLCYRKGSRTLAHYEVYLNSCSEGTKQEDLKTQLFCPVEAAE